MMGRRPIGGIFSVGVEEPYRWKDSVQSEPEIELWVAEGTANGMRPWVTKFSGVLYDRRWLPVVERIYDWHYRHERYLRNEAPLARVALLVLGADGALPSGRRAPAIAPRITCSGCITRCSRRGCRSSWCTRPSSPPSGSTGSRCWCSPTRRRSRTRSARRSATTSQRGGSLVATFASSLLRRVRPAPRSDFGLADVFGVSFGGRIDGPMQNSYLSLDA